MKKKIRQQLDIFKDRAIEVISPDELTQKLEKSLKEKNPLKIKIGFDPTAPDIHLGHSVLLRKLRKLQELGHIIYLVIGDFTALIGDPSGRDNLRPVLTEYQVKNNAQTYTSQVFKILLRSKTHVVFNSRWYKSMKLNDFMKLLSRYTVARMLERDDFSKRFRENKPLSMLEFIYPLIQGYDSVKIEADVEFGGTDQKFNLIVGRHLQESFGQQPQVVITMPLLVGTDGINKMSKSLGNYIGITESPEDMFGKIMSISDELMWQYYYYLTDSDIEEAKKLHPKEAKLRLAEQIVSFYHSPSVAVRQREEFEKVFSRKELPSEMSKYKVQDDVINIIEILKTEGLVESKNEARRLLRQGAISINGKHLDSENFRLYDKEVVLKVGKRKFLKIVREEE